MALKKQLLGIGVLALLISGCGGGSGVLAPAISVGATATGTTLDITYTVDTTKNTFNTTVTTSGGLVDFVVTAGSGAATLSKIEVQAVSSIDSSAFGGTDGRYEVPFSVQLPGGYVCSDGTAVASCPVNKRVSQKVTLAAQSLPTSLLSDALAKRIEETCSYTTSTTTVSCASVRLDMVFVGQGDAGQEVRISAFTAPLPSKVAGTIK